MSEALQLPELRLGGLGDHRPVALSRIPSGGFYDHGSGHMGGQYGVAAVAHSPVHRGAVEVSGRRGQPGRAVRELDDRQPLGLQGLKRPSPTKGIGHEFDNPPAPAGFADRLLDLATGAR